MQDLSTLQPMTHSRSRKGRPDQPPLTASSERMLNLNLDKSTHVSRHIKLAWPSLLPKKDKRCLDELFPSLNCDLFALWWLSIASNDGVGFWPSSQGSATSPPIQLKLKLIWQISTRAISVSPLTSRSFKALTAKVVGFLSHSLPQYKSTLCVRRSDKQSPVLYG